MKWFITINSDVSFLCNHVQLISLLPDILGWLISDLYLTWIFIQLVSTSALSLWSLYLEIASLDCFLLWFIVNWLSSDLADRPLSRHPCFTVQPLVNFCSTCMFTRHAPVCLLWPLWASFPSLSLLLCKFVLTTASTFLGRALHTWYESLLSHQHSLKIGLLCRTFFHLWIYLPNPYVSFNWHKLQVYRNVIFLQYFKRLTFYIPLCMRWENWVTQRKMFNGPCMVWHLTDIILVRIWHPVWCYGVVYWVECNEVFANI